jgi:hypothetical protein
MGQLRFLGQTSNTRVVLLFEKVIIMKPELWFVLAACLVGGAILSAMAKADAAALGLTAVELALLTAAAGALVQRKLS